jgi:poly-gamma-glutamate capsule biosynthesis protein CapA/YwtB (metallophosphatase superfamily)
MMHRNMAKISPSSFLICSVFLLTLPALSLASSSGISQEEKALFKLARERGWLLRDDHPVITSSDSAERAKGDFFYYLGKLLGGAIELEPVGSGFKTYFRDMDFTFHGGDHHETRAVISAVGDIMTSPSLTLQSSPNLYAYPGDFIFSTDLATGNLETTANFKQRPHGFPVFNVNQPMFDALIGKGFHGSQYGLLVTANNHMFDFGERNVRSTLDILDQYGIKHVGTARSPKEEDSFPILDVNGIRIAFLSYGYGVNRRRVPEEKYYGNLIYLNSLIPGKLDTELILRQIREARARGADIVWLNLHWGAEWELYPPVRNVEMAHQLIEAGADVIMGHHPHCLQPMERYVAKDGREAFIAYSLGNLTFNYKAFPQAKMAGAVRLYLFKDTNDHARIKKAEFLPTIHYQNAGHHFILPVDESVLAIKNGSFPHPLTKRIRKELLLNQFFLHNTILPSHTDQLLPAREKTAFDQVERDLYQ